MATINHFYRCLGCNAHHEAEATAKVCCAVVQEIFECGNCGDYFPSAGKCAEHIKLGCLHVEREAMENNRPMKRKYRQLDDADYSTGQSYAGGFGNFATP